eukprot:3535373-Prymnesium_polylepis.1
MRSPTCRVLSCNTCRTRRCTTVSNMSRMAARREGVAARRAGARRMGRTMRRTAVSRTTNATGTVTKASCISSRCSQCLFEFRRAQNGKAVTVELCGVPAPGPSAVGSCGSRRTEVISDHPHKVTQNPLSCKHRDHLKSAVNGRFAVHRAQTISATMRWGEVWFPARFE